MADDDRLLFAQRTHQFDHVAHQVQDGVLRHVGWGVGGTVTTHVGGHGPKPGTGQRRHLVAPGIPGLRKSMAQQYQRTRALFRHAHGNAVDMVFGKNLSAHWVSASALQYAPGPGCDASGGLRWSRQKGGSGPVALD